MINLDKYKNKRGVIDRLDRVVGVTGSGGY